MANQSDFEKPEWRDVTVAWTRSIKELWGSDDRFLGSYLSMIGDQGDDIFKTFQEKKLLHSPKQFVAVDTSPKVILKHLLGRGRIGHPESFDLQIGDVYEIATKMSRKSRTYPVTVFDFDGTKQAGKETWWEAEGPLLAKIVENTIKHSPCCCLILNQSIDRGDLSPEELLRRQSLLLCECFRPWRIDPKRLLGTNLRHSGKVSDYSFLGYAGAFQVYRSSKLRMVTLRIAFHAGGRVTIHKESK